MDHLAKGSCGQSRRRWTTWPKGDRTGADDAAAAAERETASSDCLLLANVTNFPNLYTHAPQTQYTNTLSTVDSPDKLVQNDFSGWGGTAWGGTAGAKAGAGAEASAAGADPRAVGGQGVHG